MVSILKTDKIQASHGSTIEIPSGHKLSGAAGSIVAPGNILQAVQTFNEGVLNANKSPLLTTTSSSFADVFSRSITTLQANSKIMIFICCVFYNGSANPRGQVKIFRDSTIIDQDMYGLYCNSSTMQNYVCQQLDSPSAAAGTTITYKMQASNTGSSSLVVGYGDGSGGGSSYFTLMEIAQ